MPFDPVLFNPARGGEPARKASAIVPSDTTDLGEPTLLYVGTGGSLRVRDLFGSTVTFANIPDGSILPLYVTRVHATSTTATDMVGLV